VQRKSRKSGLRRGAGRLRITENSGIAGRRALPRGNAISQCHRNRVGKPDLGKAGTGVHACRQNSQGHWFTRIEDHIDYLMVRIDPDKVTPLKSEAQSQDYLSKPANKGE
jgi:hypothetical protein